MSPAPAAPHPSYTTSRRRLGHTHCGDCGVAVPGRRAADVIGATRPKHPCAWGDLVECPGCLRPIVRRLPDGAPLNPDLTPHRCRGAVPETTDWELLERRLRRQSAAEARERDVEAEHYAAWVAYRRANGLPDAGEAELPGGAP